MVHRNSLLAAVFFCFLVPGWSAGQMFENPTNPGLQRELLSYPHRVIFESYIDNNWELFVVNADGSGRRNLTNTPNRHEMYPQVSPDGTKICFIQDTTQVRNTLRSIYVMDVDGANRIKVADNARQPCWSPDSETIAFVEQEFSRFSVDDFASKGMYFYDVVRRSVRRHGNAKIHHLYTLTWSADGKWIVATVHGGMGFKHGILAIQVDGNVVHNLQIGGCRPCISPDGTKIAWGRDDHTICVGDLSLSESQGTVSHVISVAHDDKLHVYHAAYSPDGKYITYSVGPGGRVPANGPGTHTQVAEMVGVRGKWDLFLSRANGQGDPAQLTHDAGLSNKESAWIRGRPENKTK